MKDAQELMIGKNVNLGYNNGNIGDSYTVYNCSSELDELSQLLLQIQSAMDQEDITAEEREAKTASIKG